MENSFEHLKELIKTYRGINLPIQGGTGDSIEDPLVIMRSEIYNCVDVEYMLVDFFSNLIGIKLEVVGQKLIIHKGRRMDILKIETKQLVGEEIITEIKNYYFDISDCFKNYLIP